MAEANLLQCDVCKAWVHVKCDDSFRSRPRPRNHRVFVCLKCNTFRVDVHGNDLETLDNAQRVRFCAEPPRYLIYSKRASTSSLLGTSLLDNDLLPTKKVSRRLIRDSEQSQASVDSHSHLEKPIVCESASQDVVPSVPIPCSEVPLQDCLFDNSSNSS